MTHSLGASRARALPATLALLAATVGGGFAAGYTLRGSRASPQAAPTTIARASAPVRVRLAASLREQAGVRVEPARRAALAPSLELAGSVEFDPDRVADVGGRIAGRVSRVFVRSGDLVRAGAPLATIVSASMGEMLASSLSARAQLAAARADAARLSSLAQLQLATGREIDEARARVATLAAELRGSEQRLAAVGARAGERDANAITLRAPLAGRVVERNAVVGQVIDPTSTMLRVADLSVVLVVLEVFERDIARIAVGDRVQIRAETHPGREFVGSVATIESTVRAETRTARVRIAVETPDEALRPGQFVTARVRLREASRDALTIPRSAVILIEGQPTVFVALDDESFEPRTVGTRAVDSDRVEIVRGIHDGERIAVDGVFALKSELQR